MRRDEGERETERDRERQRERGNNTHYKLYVYHTFVYISWNHRHDTHEYGLTNCIVGIKCVYDQRELYAILQ